MVAVARAAPDALVFDLEATCIRGPNCRVVAAAGVEVRGGVVDLSTAFCGYDPEPGSVGGSALVHGLTGAARLEHCKPRLEEALQAILDTGLPLVVYGQHDVRLLAEEARRRGLRLPARLCYIDLLAVLLRNPARAEEARRSGGLPLVRALGELLGLEEQPGGEAFHDPLDDAVYTALLYLAMSRRGDLPRPRCTGLQARRGGLLSRLRGLLHV